MKNQPKIDQKSTKNRSWRPLGASWGGLEGLEGILGASWGRLGGLLGRLGGLLGATWWPTWPQVDTQNGAQIDQKSKQKSINFWMPLGIGFLRDDGGYWRPNWGQVGTQSIQKSITKVIIKMITFRIALGTNFDRFWAPRWAPRGGPRNHFSTSLELLGPSWGQDGPKIPAKISIPPFLGYIS